MSKPSGSSMEVRKRTWPVWPWDKPTSVGGIFQMEALAVMDSVSTTPALVPIHSKSLQARSAVIRKQAALCCRMMASEPAGGTREGGGFLHGRRALAGTAGGDVAAICLGMPVSALTGSCPMVVKVWRDKPA